MFSLLTVPSILAIRDTVKAHVELGANDSLNSFVFSDLQFLLLRGVILRSFPSLEKIARTEKRAYMLCSEGGIPMQFGRHDYEPSFLSEDWLVSVRFSPSAERYVLQLKAGGLRGTK